LIDKYKEAQENIYHLCLRKCETSVWFGLINIWKRCDKPFLTYT